MSFYLPLLGTQSWIPLQKEHFTSLAFRICLNATAPVPWPICLCALRLTYLSTYLSMGCALGSTWRGRAPGSTFAERGATSSLPRPTGQPCSVASHPTDDYTAHM